MVSHTTDVISVRLPNDVLAIIKRRADKLGILPSQWLKRRITYDVRRKHGSSKRLG